MAADDRDRAYAPSPAGACAGGATACMLDDEIDAARGCGISIMTREASELAKGASSSASSAADAMRVLRSRSMQRETTWTNPGSTNRTNLETIGISPTRIF
jgi:hypothetical protein